MSLKLPLVAGAWTAVSSQTLTPYLDTDFFDHKDDMVGQVPVVYTGPVDRYFDYVEGDLREQATYQRLFETLSRPRPGAC